MARGPQHTLATMENPTPFDLNEAIRRWRAEFGSPSPLNAVELEELEAHLRDHMSSLVAGGMTPEAAFRAAVKQLGERHLVATEFAKINPQRLWLERGMWMLVGMMVSWGLVSLALVPHNLTYGVGLVAHWSLAIAKVIAELARLAVLAGGAFFCWWVLTQRPRWGDVISRTCVRQPRATCVGLWLGLWGTSILLGKATTAALNWLPPPSPADDQRFQQGEILANVLAAGIENVFLALAASFLAVWVVRKRKQRYLAGLSPSETQMIHVVSGERVLWMVVGIVSHRIIWENLLQYAMLPAALLNSATRSSPLAQHLTGLLTFVLVAILAMAPFWVFWRLVTRHSSFSAWVGWVLRLHPWVCAAGLATALNVNGILWLVFQWIGPPKSGLGISSLIVFHWQSAGYVALQVGQVLLLVLLVIWRARMREA